MVWNNQTEGAGLGSIATRTRERGRNRAKRWSRCTVKYILWLGKETQPVFVWLKISTIIVDSWDNGLPLTQTSGKIYQLFPFSPRVRLEAGNRFSLFFMLRFFLSRKLLLPVSRFFSSIYSIKVLFCLDGCISNLLKSCTCERCKQSQLSGEGQW